ncbi:hypothetical protein GCM10027590_62610 [Nocardiopsis nanhaiensis]
MHGEAFDIDFAPAAVSPWAGEEEISSPIKKNEKPFFAHRIHNSFLTRIDANRSSAARRHRRAVI